MRIFLLSACLWTVTAAAQSAPVPEGGAAVNAGAPAPAPEAVAPAAKAVEVVKVEPPKPEVPKEAPPLFRIYGMIKPTIIGAGSAVESYSQPNATAVTAAGNPFSAFNADSGRLTFQIGQSRLGVHVGEGTAYHAHIEMDFLDFTKASPTVTSVPRLRIAKLDWKPADGITVTAGQDWELAQPVNPHGMNFVGALFQAGNSSFMRQQVKVLYGTGNAEIGLAAGLRANTNTAADTALEPVEIGATPTLSMRAQYNFGKSGKIGVSGIATSILYKAAAGATDTRSFAGLGGLFADLTLGGINLRAEGYAGRNAANMYMLTLGTGRAGAGNVPIDLYELGGFLSVRVPIEMVGIYGMFGGASVLNDADVVPAASGGPGIKWNMMCRLGVDVKIWKSLSFLFEGFWVRTRRALAADSGKVSVAQAFGFETGLLLSF